MNTLSRLDRAKALISSHTASVAVVKEDGSVLTATGSSVRPLFGLYKLHQIEMIGSIVADRIIGRAAAALLCAANVKEAFGFIMSEPGKELLEAHGIVAGYGTLVPSIQNQRGDDLCPMEKRVEGIEDVPECVARIAQFIEATRPQFSSDF